MVEFIVTDWRSSHRWPGKGASPSPVTHPSTYGIKWGTRVLGLPLSPENKKNLVPRAFLLTQNVLFSQPTFKCSIPIWMCILQAPSPTKSCSTLELLWLLIESKPSLALQGSQWINLFLLHYSFLKNIFPVQIMRTWYYIFSRFNRCFSPTLLLTLPLWIGTVISCNFSSTLFISIYIFFLILWEPNHCNWAAEGSEWVN